MKFRCTLPIAALAICLAWPALAEGLFQTTTVFPTAYRNKPNYRIPSLIVMPDGDLLAIVERRNDSVADVGDHDIVMKRSRDQGKSWSEPVTLYDGNGEATSDPTLCYDRQKDVLFLFFLKDKKKFAYLRSDDEGLHWRGPVIIHDSVIAPGWDSLPPNPREQERDAALLARGGRISKTVQWGQNWPQRYGIGPGNAGIQLTIGPNAGRLLVPARHREETDGKFAGYDHIIYSDDHGASWHLGSNIALSGSETQLVELANGNVLASIRDESNEFMPDHQLQLMAVSRDGGMHWGTVRRQAELITPGVHASLKRYSLAATADRNRLLFSNPAYAVREDKHPYGRYNMTVRLSYDEGASWTAGKTIYPYVSSYSDMAVFKDGTIGIIYERGPQGSDHYWDELQYARFNLQWLTDGQDSFRPRR